MIRKNKDPVQISLLLTIAIGCLVGLSVGAVLYSTAQSNYHNTMSSFAHSTRLLLNGIEQGVRSHISPAEEVLHHMQHLAAGGELDNKTERERILLLKGILAAPHQISGVEVWDTKEHGLHVAHHGKSGFHIDIEHERDDRELAIMKSLAKKPTQIYWDAPYYHEGETSLLAYSRLDNKKHHIGTAATGVSISELSSLINTLGEAQQMTAFITYDDQHVLAHPDLLDPKILNKISAGKSLLHITALKTPLLKTLFEEGYPANPPKKDGFVIRRIKNENGGYFMFTKSLKGFSQKPWTIGIYTSAKSIDRPIKRMQQSIMVGIGLFILSILASVFLARRIAAPIKSTALAAAKIERLEIDHIQPLPPSMIKELNDQANAFNRMLGALHWFNTYVPSRLVKQLISGDGQRLVQSRAEVLTVMFTDIKGFTSLSENMTPHATAEMLNEHFETLNQCIESTGGTLDKYIGDSVMAFWGAPERQEDHAIRACKAALAIEKMLGETNGLRIKIGLHTGPLVVGNIGAKARMNYTVIGDSVNVCARIESLCGQLDDGEQSATLLISDATKRMIGDSFTTAATGEFQVKGRIEPITIWRLLA